jgi:SAM-dependent methyltransferase
MEPGEYDTLARLEGEHWWYAGMRRIATDLVGALPLPRHARILDAGCGTGGGLKWLASVGKPTGIDLHPRAVSYAARHSPRVAQASIQALPFADAAFDLVASFEVIYHLTVSDDVGALREMARVLRPGGWLLVRVPAYDWLRGAHDRQVHTRQRYSKLELRQKLAAAGLRIHKLTSVGALLLPAALLRRLVQRADRIHSDVTLPPPIVNRALTLALASERFWLRRFNFPAGLSLLAVAQKPS